MKRKMPSAAANGRAKGQSGPDIVNVDDEHVARMDGPDLPKGGGGSSKVQRKPSKRKMPRMKDFESSGLRIKPYKK